MQARMISTARWIGNREKAQFAKILLEARNDARAGDDVDGVVRRIRQKGIAGLVVRASPQTECAGPTRLTAARNRPPIWTMKKIRMTNQSPCIVTCRLGKTP